MIINYLMWDKSVLESIPINNLHDERKIQDSSICHKGESKIDKPGELSNGKFIDINEESDCDKKDEDVLEEVDSWKKLHVQGLLEID